MVAIMTYISVALGYALGSALLYTKNFCMAQHQEYVRKYVFYCAWVQCGLPVPLPIYEYTTATSDIVVDTKNDTKTA